MAASPPFSTLAPGDGGGGDRLQIRFGVLLALLSELGVFSYC